MPRRPGRAALADRPIGIGIRVPRRPAPTRPILDALSHDAATLRERERTARRAAADLDTVGADPRASAAARGKAVAYKEAADLAEATLARFTEVSRG